jgi:hypothetical protein
MSNPPKIPAFRVKVVDATSGQQEHTVHEQEFKNAPGVDFVDYKYGAQEWDRVWIRRKSFEGNMLVTWRNQSAGNTNPTLIDAGPDKPAELRSSTGQLFRVVVETLPEDTWMVGQAIKFPPPKATIAAEDAGWRVTFEPQQRPCVLTIAVAAKGVKDENLPSFPFPSNPAFTRGSFLIPYGQFGADEGGLVRLGVRGAGLVAKVALPKRGETMQIEPEHFKSEGAAQPEFLTEQYVAGKYGEKAGVVQYS